MAAIPALTRNYWSRNNMPFGAFNTTTAIVGSYPFWLLHAVLTDLISTGTASGVRVAGSKWIVRGSADGIGGGGAVSAVGVAGTNLWWNGGTFAANFVAAGNGANHNWMLLENIALGYELLLNCGNAGFASGYMTFSIGKTGCFSGGSATTCPPASSSTFSVQARQTAYSGADGGQIQLIGDVATGNTNYGHFTCADNGEFIFSLSRAGLGVFTMAVGVWRSVGKQTGDNDNTFVVAGTAEVSARGAMKTNQVNTPAFCASRQPNGSQKSSGGVITSSAGAELTLGLGADNISGLFDVEPMFIKETAPMIVRRGSLPDVYMIGTEAVGAPLPTSGASQTHVVIGDTVWPCMVVQPII